MYYFIVNPSSCSGVGRQVWQVVEQELEKEQADYRVYFTAFRYHATELAKEITSKNEHLTLIALGGDGTVNEVINGISDFSKVTFAYIPTGSSNDFARSLQLPADSAEAIRNILHPTYFKKIDLGSLGYDDKQRRFAVSCGMGFDAAVCHEALRSKIKDLLNRIKLGKLTYVGIALRQLFLFNPQKITILVDDTQKITFKSAFFISVMNCCYEGGGLKLCPNAKPDDGLLDVCVIGELSKLKIASLLPTAFWGKHTHFKGVHTYQCKKIQLSSSSILPVHADGESCMFQSSFVAECLPQKLKIIAGKI